MKRYFTLFLTVLIFFSFSACSSENSKPFTISFSEYYRDADDFNKIEPALNQYFDCIKTAFEKSNEKSLESFTLPDTYSSIQSTLASLSQAETDLTSDTYLAKLNLLEPYLQIEVLLAERTLLLSNGDTTDEEWFERLDTLFWDSIDEYRRGDGT